MKAKLFCVAYITIIVGLTIMSVGEVPTRQEPYSWNLPAVMFLLLVIPAVLGYMAGIEDGTT